MLKYKICIFAVAISLAASAQAEVFEDLNYFWVTNNQTENYSKYLETRVSADSTTSQVVDFKFSWNTGLMAADGIDWENFSGRIGEIYVMDGLTEGAKFTTTESQNVKFDPKKGKGDGGGFGGPDWFSHDFFYKESESGGATNGVHAGEWLNLEIDFTVPGAQDKDYDDVIAALNNWEPDPDSPGDYRIKNAGFDVLKIGIHMQSLPGNDESEKFLNHTPDDPFGGAGDGVPEPATLAIWGFGLAATALYRRRRRQAKA